MKAFLSETFTLFKYLQMTESS